MIDNFAIKIEDGVNTYALYTIHSGYLVSEIPDNDGNYAKYPKACPIINKVDEETFDYMDIHKAEAPNIIKQEYLNRENCWRIIASVDDEYLGFAMRQAASVGGIKHAWPGHVVANEKYKAKFETMNDLFKWQENPWHIIYDNTTDGIVMHYKNLNKGVWYYTLFYKNLDNDQIRLFYKAKDAFYSAFQNFTYLNDTYDGISLEDIPKFKEGDRVEYTEARIFYNTGKIEKHQGIVKTCIERSNFTGHKGYRYVIYPDGTDMAQRFPNTELGYETEMEFI